MIDPSVRAALEQARDRSGHRSVTIKREHLRHVLARDRDDVAAGRVMAGLINRQGKEVEALRAQLAESPVEPRPFAPLGWWPWPLLMTLSAIGGALAR